MSQSPCDDGDAEPVPPWNAFSQDGTADVPPPGPELTALLGAAVAALGELDERQLLGAGSAARRLQAHAEYLEIVEVAEFARLRAEQLEASKARGDRVRSRDGEYPAEELGFEMTATAYSAAVLLDMAQNIVGRLPSTLAGMAAGEIDRDRARVISNATLHLPDDLAAEADKILAEAAPEMRSRTCTRRPPGSRPASTPRACRSGRTRPGMTGGSSCAARTPGRRRLSGRELDPAEALAGKASIDAEAVRLRNAGLPGTLAQIRATILSTGSTSAAPGTASPPAPEPEPDEGCDGECRRRLRRQPRPGAEPGCRPVPAADPDPDGPPDDPYHDDPDHQDPCDDGQFPGAGEDDEDEEEEDEGRPAGLTGGAPPGSPFDQTGRKTPMPALINITIPAGTLLGWSTPPPTSGSWGLMDADAVRDLIEAASRHPRTRWCYTLTGHRRPGHRPRLRARIPPLATAPAQAQPDGPAPPTPRQAQLAELLAGLNAAPEPIARGSCDHAHREDRYIPSRKLKHLIRARTARCCAPGCGAQAITSEIDHTIPHPAGATCECNLSPACQRHHHAKHAPGWKLQQTEPGVMRWTTPSGRTYTTHPTQYEE